MSEYLKFRLKFTDRAAFEEALMEVCAQLNIEVEFGRERRLALYDFHGAKSPDAADYVIRRRFVGEYANDIGFCWDGQEMEVIISDFNFDRQPVIMRALKQHYGLISKCRELEAKGLEVVKMWTDEKGNLRATLKPGRNYRPAARRQTAQHQTVGRR